MVLLTTEPKSLEIKHIVEHLKRISKWWMVERIGLKGREGRSVVIA